MTSFDDAIPMDDYLYILRVFKIRSKDVVKHISKEDDKRPKTNLVRALSKRQFFKALRRAIIDDILTMEQEAVKEKMRNK